MKETAPHGTSEPLGPGFDSTKAERPGGSPAGLDWTRQWSFLVGGGKNLCRPPIFTLDAGGKAFSLGSSSPAGPLSFLDLPPGRSKTGLFFKGPIPFNPG